VKTNDFLCSPCRNKWEHTWKQGEKIKCPKCGTEKVKKLLSAPVFHFNQITDKSLREEKVI